MSFLDATLVLSIGETVEEVTDSGFNGKTRTLSASRLGDDAFVQVRLLLLGRSGRFFEQIHPDGVRHIFPDKRVSEWKPPGKRHISQCAVNDRQVAVAVGHEVVYFELDRYGQLNEYTERKEMPADVWPDRHSGSVSAWRRSSAWRLGPLWRARTARAS